MFFPEDISEHGHLLDELFWLTVWLTGVTFVIVIALLGYFLYAYLSKPGLKAFYTHGNTAGALGLTLGLALAVFVIIDLNLAWHDHHVFAKLFGNPPKDEDAMQVDVVAEVFAWNFRYPGADGAFGEIDLVKAGGSDPTGVVAAGDPAGADDIVSVGRLVVPVGRDIVLKMKSKDVIHSLFLPNLRIKQDVVPGLETKLYFKAIKTGEYEIACAELCGLGHYRMRGFLEVKEQADYDAWIAERVAEMNIDESEFTN